MKHILVILLSLIMYSMFGQERIYYQIDGIEVVGNRTTSDDAILIISGLKLGSYITIPSSKVQIAIKKLWDTGVFYDIKVSKNVVDEKVTLVLELKEYQLLGKLTFEGLNSSEVNKMTKNAWLKEVNRYSPHAISVAKREINKLMFSKGYRHAEINQQASTDSIGKVDLTFTVSKGERVKIGTIDFIGNAGLTKTKLLKALNEKGSDAAFKKSNFYSHSATFLEKKVLKIYKDNGFLDASIDSVIEQEIASKVHFKVYVTEGELYYLNAVSFEGNELFSSAELSKITAPLIAKKYSKSKLETLLFFEENRKDITSAYLDNSYANLKLKYRESIVGKNSVHVIVSIVEGEQYEFGKIDFRGNVRTKDKVLHHTVITTAGTPFSRSKIIVSQQKLMQLDYFIPENFDIGMIIDTTTKSVAVNYVLKERISDRFLVSGGFDGRYLIGSLGFDFKNFELADVFKRGARWNPLPAGGGQHLSLKGQSDATNYYGFSFLFEEPRFRNKAMGVGLSSDYAYYRDGSEGNLKLFSTQIGVSHFPQKKNPFLRLSHQLNYRYYHPENYSLFGFSDGFYNALTYRASLLKQTTNNTYYPTKGQVFKLEGISTLPSSLIKEPALGISDQEKYKWLEYYKLKAAFKHYLPVDKSNKTVIASTLGIGYLGRYNKNLADRKSVV